MNRKEKYMRLRVNRRINFSKHALLAISISSLFLFSFCIMSFGTYSYFTAQADFNFNVKNATKSELVQITEGPLEYPDKCLAEKKVTIKNIFDYKVIITIENTKYTLYPGQEITHTQVVADHCNEFGDRSFTIIGYENYFTHEVEVVVDKNLLNPCPPQSDNGQGKPNENGQGRQCGHTDTSGGQSQTDPAENDEPSEQPPPAKEEKTLSESNKTETKSDKPEKEQKENEEITPEKENSDAINEEQPPAAPSPNDETAPETEQPPQPEQPQKEQEEISKTQPASAQGADEEKNIDTESAP